MGGGGGVHTKGRVQTLEPWREENAGDAALTVEG